MKASFVSAWFLYSNSTLCNLNEGSIIPNHNVLVNSNSTLCNKKRQEIKHFLPFYFFTNNLPEYQQALTHYPHQFS